MFVSTLREAFEGNEELFDGLALHGKWDWSTRYPIVHIDFSNATFSSTAKFNGVINYQFRKIEKGSGFSTETQLHETRLTEIIDNLHSQTGLPVVLLVDEHDKPILDAISNPQVAITNRDILRGLCGTTKFSEDQIRFSFFTGVGRFAKTSLFSGANNLDDITIDPEYSSICGYSESDLDAIFAPELEGLEREKIREWYNGYSWLGEEKVYNPYDILCLLKRRKFEPWWFRTGHPSFLTDTLKKKQVMSINLNRMRPRSSLLESFDVDKIELETLLFQTGYLTITEEISDGGSIRYRLNYPNREVKENLNILLLKDLLPSKAEELLLERANLLDYMLACDVDQMKTLFQSVLAGLPKQWHAPVDLTKYEAYFASVFYSYFMGMGLMVRAEEATSRGRIDLVVEGPSYVYIFEFKMVNGKKRGEAIQQILDMEYSQKYRGTDNPLYLAGVEVSKETHNIVEFEVLEDDGGGR